MKRRLEYDRKKEISSLKINPDDSIKDTKLYTPSVATVFEVIKHKNIDKIESISLTTDIQMLLRQTELVNKDPGFVKEYMENMIASFSQATARDKALENIKSKLSDDQLMKYVKSRHIQSIEELKTYGKYILEEAMDADENIKDLIEETKSIVPDPIETPKDTDTTNV